MTGLVTQLPTRRAELLIRPLGDEGRYVVKDPSRRDYFELGEEEFRRSGSRLTLVCCVL